MPTPEMVLAGSSASDMEERTVCLVTYIAGKGGACTAMSDSDITVVREHIGSPYPCSDWNKLDAFLSLLDEDPGYSNELEVL